MSDTIPDRVTETLPSEWDVGAFIDLFEMNLTYINNCLMIFQTCDETLV
jgi:hypothetical protein